MSKCDTNGSEEFLVILETTFHKGEGSKPLLIFIHGMGMNMTAWSDPGKARILGGKYPLRALAGRGDEMETSFGDLKKLGFPVLSWTQSRPAGLIRIAVDELRYLMEEYRSRAGNGVILICHSRGGLVGRKYLEEYDRSVRGLVTLSTPHLGTTMAKWALSLLPVTSTLNRYIKGVAQQEADSAFKRVLSFLCSSGLRELLPDSEFFLGLHDRKQQGTRYISLGGTNPDLLKAISVSLPELISKMVPERIVPYEMREGYGDGLVSAASSELPYGDEHRNFPVNHAAVLFDKEVRNYAVDAVDSCLSGQSRPVFS
jgi:pimeloyl-ACP methyl ester carboxylesterase